MENQQERQCSNCGRIYTWEDWQQDNCPVCEDVALEPIDGEGSEAFLDDTLSQDIPWPRGEREVEVCRASGYLDGQMIKAQLEGAGIPVLLHAGAKLGFTVGDLGAVPVMVPMSRRDEALDILEERF
ncbi:MAG: hypothetical protein JWP00_2932 [Chloroflexi bacterium]|nr:hypothetical protein [Chloroflexota bacterium]